MLYAWYMFDMLTPMLSIFLWTKRWGAIRDKTLHMSQLWNSKR